MIQPDGPLVNDEPSLPRGRAPGLWYRSQTRSWYTTFGGRQLRLGSDREEAQRELDRLTGGAKQVRREALSRAYDSWVEKQDMIYFIQDTETRNIKIGISFNPRLRLQGLQSATPHRLVLLHAFPGWRGNEWYLHRYFRSSRIRGEWFRETPELLAVIQGLIDGSLKELPE